MNGIEKELEDLAMKQGRNVPPARLPERLERRIRTRRGLLGLGWISIVLAVLAGTMWAMPRDPFSYLDPADKGSDKPVSCYELRTKDNACPGVELSIELPRESVEPGKELRGQLVFHNTNPYPVVLDGDQPEFADFLDPSTGRLVGGYQGLVAGTGWGGVVASDETANMRLIATAVAHVDDLNPGVDQQPPLPEGEYVLRATTRSCKPVGGPCEAYAPAYSSIIVWSP